MLNIGRVRLLHHLVNDFGMNADKYDPHGRYGEQGPSSKASLKAQLKGITKGTAQTDQRASATDRKRAGG